MSTHRREVTFDQNSAAYTGDYDTRVAKWNQLRETCPVGWNTSYGGFWLLSDFTSVQTASRQSDTFAHKYESAAEDGIEYIGQLGIPRNELPKLGIGETDGPMHQDIRRALNPLFSNRAVSRFREDMSATSAWFLDQRIESGHIDLINDFASPVTALVTLHMLGLPTARWADYADVFHASQGYAPDSPEWKRALYERAPELLDEILQSALRRRADPRNDILTAVACLQTEGRLLNDQEIKDILWNVVGGGIDTTTSVVARGLIYLDLNPTDREHLAHNPEQLPTAIEEFLRVYPSVQALTRTVTADTVIDNQLLSRGDRALLVHVAANRDPQEFASPDEVDIARDPNRHLTFGLGSHRCIGLHLARIVLEVMFKEILTRIPDYKINHEEIVEYSGFSETIGIHRLPAQFSPGARASNAPAFLSDLG